MGPLVLPRCAPRVASHKQRERTTALRPRPRPLACSRLRPCLNTSDVSPRSAATGRGPVCSPGHVAPPVPTRPTSFPSSVRAEVGCLAPRAGRARAATHAAHGTRAHIRAKKFEKFRQAGPFPFLQGPFTHRPNESTGHCTAQVAASQHSTTTRTHALTRTAVARFYFRLARWHQSRCWF